MLGSGPLLRLKIRKGESWPPSYVGGHDMLLQTLRIDCKRKKKSYAVGV